MANISKNTQSPTWAQGIYQIETSDPVLGGANGIANRQARELAARTQWLKAEIAKAVQSIGSNKTTTDNSLALKANAATQISAGAGLTGGGTLAANRTIGLATPSTLSGSTTNWVGNGATGHTHEIARATPTLAGVVKLVNTLDSTALDAALTAAMGKKLNDEKLGNTGTQELAGHLVVKYANDWVGMVAHNPTPNKHVFFDGVVNNIPKGGLQIIANDNGAYFVRITATPQGNANQDRRVASADFYAGSIWTNAYGWLHEGFVRAGNGIGQLANHQIKIGWSNDRRLKATVDDVDLGGIVTDPVLKPYLDNINNGIHNHVQNLLNILNNKAERAHFTHTDYPNHYAGAEVWRMPNGLKITIMQIKGAQRGNIHYLPEAYQGRFIAIGNDYGGGANAVTTTPIHGTNQIRINASGPTTDVNIIAIGWANNGY